MINLPNYIKDSVILTDDDKLILASIESLPTDLEVDNIRTLAPIQELLNAFIGDESTRDTHLQLKAKEYLNVGEVEMAWKVLLL